MTAGTRCVRRLRLVAASMVVALSPVNAQAPERWALVEEVRIGTVDEGPAMFSDLRGMGIGANGDIYVLDYRAQEVRQFDPRGTFVRRFGRQGSGPGETRNANGLLVAPDGRVWLNDPSNSRYVVFDRAGRFETIHTVNIRGYGYTWEAMFDTAGVLHDVVFLTGEPHRAIRRMRPTGVVLDTVPLPTCGRERRPEDRVFQARTESRGRVAQIPFVPEPRTAWDSRGFLWCTPSDVYDVVRIRLGRGDTAQRIERTVEPPPVSGAERDEAIARIRETFRDFPGVQLDFSKIPRVKPVIDAIHVDDAGRLWVRRSGTDSLRVAYDVFDAAGRLTATVDGRMRLRGAMAPIVKGDAFYAMVLDEDDVQYVVRARIRRGGT